MRILQIAAVHANVTNSTPHLNVLFVSLACIHKIGIAFKCVIFTLMDIIYLGHASFKLRGKTGIVVTDPFDSEFVGFDFPKVSADIVTVSHHHPDHDNVQAVSGTARRPEPFIIDAPGEYELQDISIFGYASFHDDKNGAERGKNTIMVIAIDGIRVAHLGDLGHTLSDQQIDNLGAIDVLLIGVGGDSAIGPKQAAEIIQAIEPSIVIPMHYKTEKHTAQPFAKKLPIEAFLKEMGKEGIEPIEKLTLTPGSLPEEMEVVVLKN